MNSVENRAINVGKNADDRCTGWATDGNAEHRQSNFIILRGAGCVDSIITTVW